MGIARLLLSLKPVADAIKAQKLQRISDPYFLKAVSADLPIDPQTGRAKAKLGQLFLGATSPAVYTKKYGMPSLLQTPPPRPASLGAVSNVSRMQPGAIYPAWYANAPANIPTNAPTTPAYSYYTLDDTLPSDKLKKFLEEYWRKKNV